MTTTSITFLCPDDLMAALAAEIGRRLNENPTARINRSTVINDALRALLIAKGDTPETEAPTEKPLN